MRKSLLALSVSALMAGCAPARFYINETADAHSITRSVSVEKIDAENTKFNVYKVNGANYALLPYPSQAQDRLAEIGGALIFSEKDIEELKNACHKIVAAHDLSSGETMEIIEYHLVLNAVHLAGTGSAFVSDSSISTSTQVSEIQNVVFRLQYLYQPRAVWGPQKRINYMFHGRTGSLSVNDVKALLTDLEQ